MPLNALDIGGVGRSPAKITSYHSFFKAIDINRQAFHGTLTKMKQREGSYLFQSFFVLTATHSEGKSDSSS